LVILETLAKRSEGLADLLAAVAQREEVSGKSIDALAEAGTVLLNPIVEADEAKADDK
jgi:hypothetical protein